MGSQEIKASSGSLLFGPFELDRANGELKRNGSVLRIQKQTAVLLLYLANEAGRMVSREQLKAALWPSDTFVDFEYSLNTAVNRARRILGDSAENPRYIETVPRQGYRFIATVQRVDPPAEHTEAPAGTPETQPVTGPRGASRRWLGLSAAAVILVAAVVVAMPVARNAAVPGSPVPADKLWASAPRPFSMLPGTERRPAFAPDGDRVAFDWQPPDTPFQDIYVKRVGEDTPTRVTSGPDDKIAPAWSPDGMQIAYLRRSGDGSYRICSIPAAGGAEKEWGQVGASMAPHLDWSRDGEFFAAVDRRRVDGPTSVALVWLRTGEKVWLTAPTGTMSDNYPMISPDSRSIAFCRSLTSSVEDIFLAPVRKTTVPDSELKAITNDRSGTFGMTWMPDGKSLLLSSQRAGARSTLWSVPVSGGKPTLATAAGWDIQMPAVNRAGNRLVWLNIADQYDIWKLDSDGKSSTDLISDTGLNSGPQVSPDGSRIAFRSNRSGNDEIWIASSDGSGQRRITSFNGPLTGSARWSPDGIGLVYESRMAGKACLFVQSIYSGGPQRLTDGKSDAILPSWSRDGKWIYFTSNREEGWQVWKMSAAGSNVERVTLHGGFAPFEAPEGDFLYYAKRNGKGIWRMPLAGGEEQLVLAGLDDSMWGNWAITRKGLYYVALAPGETNRWAIFLLERGSRQGRMISRIAARPARWDSGLSASADGSRLFFSELERQSADLMMLEASK